MNLKIKWTDDELQYLKSNYNIKTNLELSIELNKTKKNIGRVLKQLGLYKDKESIKKIKTRRNKEVGRDLDFETIYVIAKSFNSRGEFYQYDNVAYNKAVKNGWLNSVCEHMVIKHISLPQLILKDILEFILNDKCVYNDRETINPLEIDCYFPKWKLGWEYDGKYFHKDKNDELKKNICKNKNIILLNIDEHHKEYRKYEVNIKNQLIKQIPIIEKVINKKISADRILNYVPKITLPNLLTIDEKKIVENKKMSEIKLIDVLLYRRIKKYRLYEDIYLKIENDLKTKKTFRSFEDYKNYLIHCNYKNFSELCLYEHPHRLLKKWGLSIILIHDLFKLK